MVALRRGVDRLVGLWNGVADVVPPTWAGLWVGVLSAWAVVGFGFGKIDLVLLLIGAVGLGLLTVSVLAVSIVAAIAYWQLRRLESDARLEVECGYPRRTGFSMPSLWFLPIANLTWTWTEPAAIVKHLHQRGRVEEQVTLTRRGDHPRIVRRVEITDTFGLARLAFQVVQERSVRGVPSTGNLEQMHVVRGLAGGDGLSHPDGPPEGDPYDMRQYAVGDPIKFVLWKVFARNRQLVIRTPERALSPVQQTVAYLVAGSGDEPAAGAAKVAVRGGALGSDWVLGADGVGQAVRTLSAVDDVLIRSASVPHEDGGGGLLGFLQDVGKTGARRAVLFCPPTPGPWLDRIEDVLARADASTQVDLVVCTDGVQPAPRRSWVRRVLTHPSAAQRTAHTPATREDLEVVLQRLGRLSDGVMLVDRQQGTVHPAAQLRFMGKAS